VTGRPADTAWLPGHRPNPVASLRLICFPYAGGGTVVFHGWSKVLPLGIEVCPVQLPGREKRLREPPYKRLPELVQSIAEDLSSHFMKPFALFGHSLGALVSFELARLLRRERGIQPVQMFVSGRPAPQIATTRSSIYELPDPEFLKELRRLNGTPREVLEHPELMDVLLPTLRADFEVAHTYDYESDSPLDCPIMAFGGLQDPDISCEQLERWREQTTASFSSRMFPGDHFFINTTRTLLLRTLSQQLELLVAESI
jgi:medium-chain acyl-[acyl-carrier-protein] hydrolase